MHEDTRETRDRLYKLFEAGDIKGVSEIVSEIGSKVGRENALVGFLCMGEAFVHQQKGEQDKAIDGYKSAVALFDGKEELQPDIARAEWLLGDSHRSLDDYEKALEHYGNSKTIAIDSGDEIARTNASFGIAHVNELRGNFDIVAHEMLEALEVTPWDGSGQSSQIKAKTLYRLGAALRLVWNLKDAEECYKESLGISDDFDLVTDRAYAVRGLAEVARLEGDLDGGLELYMQADYVFKDTRPRGQVWLMRGKAEIMRARGDTANALRLYGSYTEKTGKMKNLNGHAHGLTGIGYALGSKGEFDRALGCFEKAVGVYNKYGSQYGLILAFLGMSSALAGNGKDAGHYISEARKICEMTGNHHYRKALLDVEINGPQFPPLNFT